ncbi:hypothetical protein SVIOM342S_07322 [Streptomyces violaceorubidus]
MTGLVGLLSRKLFDYAPGERVASEPGEADLPQLDEARSMQGIGKAAGATVVAIGGGNDR